MGTGHDADARRRLRQDRKAADRLPRHERSSAPTRTRRCGRRSPPASRTSFWDVVHGLYLNQGAENAGWVTDDARREIAADAGLDGALLDRRWDKRSRPGSSAWPARRRPPALTARRRSRSARQEGRSSRSRSARSGRKGSFRQSTRCWRHERADTATDSAALAALGAAITGYLLYARETGTELACATGGCETVQSSAYAEVSGVPVAALGLDRLSRAPRCRARPRRLGAAGPGDARAGGAHLQRLPAHHPARSHRRPLPVVPGNRCDLDGPRRSGAPSSPLRRPGTADRGSGPARPEAATERPTSARAEDPTRASAVSSSLTPAAPRPRSSSLHQGWTRSSACRPEAPAAHPSRAGRDPRRRHRV